MTENEKARTDGEPSQNSLIISLSAPIKKVLSKLEGVKGRNGQRTAKCPAHDDQRNSLSIAEGEDGRVLLTCHANCTTAEIVNALGLKMKDLFPAIDKSAMKSKPKIVAAYDYADKSGELLYQVVRFIPKDFKQRRPKPGGGWTWKLGDVRRVLYRLPEVLEAVRAGDPVYVVEGEKDVAALERLGLEATCNAGGAGKWLDSYSESLRGAHVAVLPDNDEPGRKHAEAVKKSLKGIAASVKVIYLPGLPDKGDVSDWVAAGGTAEELKALVKPATNTGAKRPLGRMLRQDVSRSKKLAALSQDSLALFLLLIPHFNNHGKMAANPYTVKGTVAPLIDWLDIPTIKRCLTEIGEKTNVKWFQYDGLWYLHSLSWREHQDLRKNRLGQDHLPSYSGSSPGVVPDFPSSSSSSSSSSSQRKK